MARIKNTILGNKGPGEKSLNGKGIVDISQMNVGQNGHDVNLVGLVANSPHIRRNLFAVLVDAPKGFNDLPDPDVWRAALKNMVELLPNSIEGLNSTLTVDYGEEAIGGAGEVQETETNVTRARSVPVFNFTEKYGKPINTLLTGWITNLIMDPNTKVPNVMTRSSNKPSDILPDYNGMKVIFIEPDPTNTRVVMSWLCGNMKPKSAGDVIGGRDLTAAGETTTYAIEFTSVTQVGLGVNLLAQKYLDEMNMVGVNPNLKPAFVDGISADVKAAETGYSERMNSDSSNALQTPTGSY